MNKTFSMGLDLNRLKGAVYIWEAQFPFRFAKTSVDDGHLLMDRIFWGMASPSKMEKLA